MIVDIVILITVILFAIVGRHRGLTVTLVSFFSLIIAVIVALMTYKPVGNYIKDETPIGENVKQVIKQNIPLNDENLQLDENSSLPESMKNYINKKAKEANATKDETIDSVSTELATEVIMMISFVAIFLVVRVALLIIKVIARLINKLPILKQLDHLGGAIVGVIQGIIVVYFVFAVISVVSPVFKNTKVFDQINDSFVGKMMYNNNIILNKIKNL